MAYKTTMAPPGATYISLDTGNPDWSKSSTSDIFILEDDFVYYNQGIQVITYITEQLGTGATFFFSNAALSSSQAIGEAQLNTGTDTTGSAQISIIGNANNPYVSLGAGYHQLDFLVNIPTLATAGQDYIVTFGLGTQSSVNLTGEPGNDAVYFQYNRSSSTNWIGASAKQGSGTTTASGGTPVAVATGYNQLRITINAAANSCNFLVNGTSIGTTAATIPTNPIGLLFKIRKTAGTTARTVNMDYWRHYIRLTTSRFTF